MSAPTQTLTAVAADAAHWDVGGYRIWASTEPQVLLYQRTELRFAVDSQRRPIATVTRYREWTGTGFRTTGGAATLEFSGSLTEDPAVLLSLQDTWTRAIRADGYLGEDPRYVPMPVRDAVLSAEVDAVRTTTTGTTVQVELAAAEADRWAAAVTDKGPVAGTITLSCSYPRLMPPATSVVRLHGRKVYNGLAATLTRAEDGEISGTTGEIRAAWAELVRTGAVEVTFSGAPAGDLLAARDALVDQIRENLFDLMFAVRQEATTGPPICVLRWKRAADVPDLPLSVTVGGLTWLTGTTVASVAELLARLDSSVVRDVNAAVSVPVQVTVQPCELVASVSVSLDFGDLRPPAVLTFDKAGGTRTTTVTTEHPAQLTVEHRTQIVFSAPHLPVVSVHETTEPGSPHVHVRPEQWLVKQEIFLAVFDDDRLAGRADDVVSLTARCGNTVWSATLAPDGVVTVHYPATGERHALCTVIVAGSVGGQLVQGSRELPADADVVLLLVQNGSLRVLTGDEAGDEVSDRPLGTPLVRRQVPPDAEAGRPVSVTVPVALVPQPTTTSGWAAALAALVEAREHKAITPAQVAADAGLDLDTSYPWQRIRAAVGTWRLAEERVTGLSPRDWAALLREWGPVWAVRPDAPHRGVVVCGIDGDGTPEGTSVRVNDPWPPFAGTAEHITFTRFDREFGAGAETALVHG
ncbi:papain-like cysteine protease family protein [Lentzea chajnantorensis]